MKRIRQVMGIIEEDYSPAGQRIIPNEIVIHKSAPSLRHFILEEGLKVSVGDCYSWFVGREDCIPAIFATNSTNEADWFDSTYDDDVWEINTKLIPEVKWYSDKHYDEGQNENKHIVTFDNIPLSAIKLKYEGSGDGIM